MAVLDVKNLHVEIDGMEILEGLDLAVNAGEVHAIMGPNGSGKSTLAYVLAGKKDYAPTAGEVLFDGKNIFDIELDEREINSLRIFGTAKEKGAIVAFEMKGAHPHDVATVIDRSGVAVRAATHCVMPLLARFGVTATCRASFAMYNTRAEVDILAQALVKAQEFFT